MAVEVHGPGRAGSGHRADVGDAVPRGARGPGAGATWGLLAAWAVHDLEELATMAAWIRRNRDRVGTTLPPALANRLDELGGDEHVALAIGLMGGLIATAAAQGARTDGRGRFYQSVLFGFGAHGAGHVLISVGARQYTPGVVTAPTIVIPFSWWAWRRLRSAGLRPAPPPVAALALIPASIGAAHLGASLLQRGYARLRRHGPHRTLLGTGTTRPG